MGRGKVEMKRIANKINRQVTFSKRKGGLMKKANEISVLCDAEVALIVFSHKGKLFQYSSTHSCMEGILDRYERYSFSGREHVVNETKLSGSWTMEYTKMKAKMELLQENIRHYMGEDLESLSMKNLQHLEQQLDNARKHIRSKKNQLLYQSISDLQKREKTMEDQNSMLANKIEENEKTKANLQEQQNHGLNSSSFFMAQPLLPNLNIGGIYQEGGGRRNHELDLTRVPLFLTNSCQLGFFPSH